MPTFFLLATYRYLLYILTSVVSVKQLKPVQYCRAYIVYFRLRLSFCPYFGSGSNPVFFFYLPRRGETARRRQALSCIMQLELNTNNEMEIQREAANIRKALFFRSLAMQFF